MASLPDLPAELKAEVTRRIAETTGLAETLALLFQTDELPSMPGAELEKLLASSWLIGYGAALTDIADGPGPYPRVPAAITHWLDELAPAEPVPLALLCQCGHRPEQHRSHNRRRCNLCACAGYTAAR